MATPATFGQSVLDAQLDGIKNVTTTILLCKNYLRTDSYGDIVPAKVVASLGSINSGHALWGARTDEVTASPTDDANAPSRRQAIEAVTLASAVLDATNGSDDLSLILASDSEVLAVTDETSDRSVTVGDVITTFAYYIQSTQPDSV